MSFPSRYPGRCTRCAGPIATGELIDYDRASKTAWHTGCALPEALPTEGQEPGEIAKPPKRRGPYRRKATISPEEAWANTVEHGRADVVLCEACGGSAAGRPMVHISCVGSQGDVPF